MSEAVSIEPIRPEHVESFREALDVVSRERKYLAFLEAPPLVEVRAFVLDMIANGHPQLVALQGDRVVGWCDVRRSNRQTEAHRGTLGMGIVPGHRGNGLGLRLMLATLDAARAAGLHRVELTVHAPNSVAIRLYEKVGFVREGVARDGVLIDGRYIDSVSMAILFPDCDRVGSGQVGAV